MFEFGGGVVAILFALVAAFGVMMRKGSLAVAGPVLVLRKFEVTGPETPSVEIQGRPSGLVAWLLTTLGLDTLTTLRIDEEGAVLTSASLSGVLRHLIPATAISSTHCGYSQPIWLLIIGAAIFVFSMLSASVSGTAIFSFGVIVAMLCGIAFWFQRKIVIAIETTGGAVFGVAFNPSAIEHVTVDLARAQEAVDQVHRILLARSRVEIR